MHRQQLLNEIKVNLYSDPQKCIKILSNKSFLNNLFQEHLVQLTQVLENALQKSSKDNKGISFINPNQVSTANGQSVTKRPEELNAQLIVTLYSIIIMKSTSKSIITAEECPIFSTKIAIQTLSKIHRQIKREDIKKIVSALLLKVPTFGNHKNIVRQISPQFVSMKVMEKASGFFRTQCPNLYDQKLLAHKETQWGSLLAYKPFKLDAYAETFKKLTTTGTVSTDANALIEIRDELKRESEFLLRRIDLINKEEFFMYEFCEKFTELYRTRLEFSKLLDGHKFSSGSMNSSKVLPSYNLNELRLKVLLEAKNQLLVILTSLIKKLSSYWTRKLKWLYEFIIERIEIYGLQELGLSSIQEPDIYIEKLTELKLLIKLAHTYYRVFGDGLFPEQKLKSILFTQEYSFYKLVESLLYNEYEFSYQPETNRIVNYQKTKKVSEESKTKKSLIKTININSKSLNINPHYDLVFQKVIQQITNKNGEAYSFSRELIAEVLKFMCTYYKRSETFFYGGNLTTMIENCKNSQIPKRKILELVKEIKAILYPSKKMTKQGLQFFCEQVFQNYISKKRHLQTHQLQCQQQQRSSQNFNICKTNYLTIHSSIQLSHNQNALKTQQPSVSQNNLQAKGAIKKTKSYDMAMEGWNSNEQQSSYGNQQGKQVVNPELGSMKQSEMFYSIKECSIVEENQKKGGIDSGMGEEIQGEQQEGDQFILTPDF